MLALDAGTRLNALFPVARSPRSRRTAARCKEEGPAQEGREKSSKNARSNPSEALELRLFELRKRGFNRLFQPARFTSSPRPSRCWNLAFTQPLYVLVDRLVISPDMRSRLVDAIETGYREAGEVIFQTVPRDEAEAPRQFRFAQRFECKQCRLRYEEPEPRLFSFNNPYGACPQCQGFGNTIDFDLGLVVPDKSKTLAAGAIEPWTKPRYRRWSTN